MDALSKFVSGGSPMEGTVKLDGLAGQLIEIYTFNEYEGDRGPYVVMDIIRVDTGEELKARTSAVAVIDRMKRAIAAGAVLPVSAKVIQAMNAQKRPYFTLE